MRVDTITIRARLILFHFLSGIMKNVEMSTEGTILIIGFDLTKEFGLSSSTCLELE